MLTFFLGLVSGVVSGMGMGGATILTIFLVLTLNLQQQMAQSINLVFFIPTALIATFVHIKNKNVEIHIATIIIVGSLIGTIGGSLLAIKLSPILLRRIFASYLLVMGIYQILNKNEKAR